MPVPVLPGSSSGAPAVPLTVAERTPSLEVRALWRPEQFTRITNPGFESDTSGWSVSAGINAAGTTIDRDTTDPHSGTGCGRLVTAATADSGMNFDLGADTYHADPLYSTVYVVGIWLRRISGGRRAKLILGSQGTSALRASLEIHDLPDAWTEYLLAWRPAASASDCQLAVVTGDGRSITIDVDDVAVYSPQFSQIENGTFETDVSGWTTDGSLVATAADSMTRVVGGAIAGSASAAIVTTSDADSGVDWSFGTRRFIAGRTYRIRCGLRNVSGLAAVRVRFGSLGTSGDRGDSALTITSDSTWHTVDWTPAADRYDVVAVFSNTTAAARGFRLDEVEAYEAIDEITPDSFEVARGASFDGSSDPPGTIGGSIADISDTYTPWNTASVLYPSLLTAIRRVPVWARATHDDRARGIAWGRLNALVPDPYGKHVHFTAADGLADLANVGITRPFRSDLSFAAAREQALDEAGVGAMQRDLDTGGPESGSFFDGADQSVKALGYLGELNSATGSIHVAEPSPHANIGWIYRTTNRAAITDASVIDWTIDDDSRGPLSGVDTRDESIITSARLTWQGYELLGTPDPPGTIALPWGSEAVDPGVGILALGGDPSQLADVVPYMDYSRPEFGSFEPPEPETIYTVRRVKGKRKRRRRLRWTDPLFPLTVPAGSSRTFEVDLSLPVEDMDLRWTPSSVSVTLAAEPARAVITIEAGESDVTLDGLAIIGRPFLPATEAEIERGSSSAAFGPREPASLSDAYVSGPGQGEGILDYLLWRYDRARLRPVVKDALEPDRMLGARVGDTMRVTIARYKLASLVFVVTGTRHIINRPGSTDWHTEYSLEELPTDAGPWVVIGGGASTGIGSGRRLAH